MTATNEPPAQAAELNSGAVPGPSGRYATKAVLALVLGVISLLLLLPASLLALLAAITAVVLGHLAIREISSSGDRGRGIAAGGLATGYLTICIAAVVVLGAIITTGSIISTGPHVQERDACTSKTGDFTQKQLQRCFDQTNGN